MNAMKMKNKVENLRWQMNGNGGFVGRFFVNRKPFGEFTVKMEIGLKNGKTSVSIKSYDYKAFDWHKECETLEEAIECLEKEFDEIVKLAIEMQEQHDAVIRKAIQEINRRIEARKGDCVCQKS